MSHKEQRDFIKSILDKYPSYFNDCDVLEIGSLNINGTVRDFFTNCEYIGLDVAEGKDVDIVCQGQDFDAPQNSFDTVISCEAMEHNPYWEETFLNMINVCKSDGLIVMTCATTGRMEHGTSSSSPKDSPLTIDIGWDYYNNLEEKDFTLNIDFESKFKEYSFLKNENSHDLYFFGIKA